MNKSLIFQKSLRTRVLDDSDEDCDSEGGDTVESVNETTADPGHMEKSTLDDDQTETTVVPLTKVG